MLSFVSRLLHNLSDTFATLHDGYCACNLLTLYSGQEQVVPSYNSPLCMEDYCRMDIQRKLPENNEGVKPLDLFKGDDIFAYHEE